LEKQRILHDLLVWVGHNAHEVFPARDGFSHGDIVSKPFRDVIYRWHTGCMRYGFRQ
jgi:hypothetical protein